jgi:uncharacterized membrane protein YhaH (DUF805 family)
MANEFNPYYTVPAADQLESAYTPGEMPWKEVWFSFDGRISRSTFWLKGLLPLYGLIIFLGVVYGVLSAIVKHAEIEALSTAATVLGALVISIGAICFFWIYLAVYTKRWHDHGKSGWWQLIAIIPYIGGLWVLVECGFLAGDAGPNAFGPDPLGGQPPL